MNLFLLLNTKENIMRICASKQLMTSIECIFFYMEINWVPVHCLVTHILLFRKSKKFIQVWNNLWVSKLHDDRIFICGELSL